MNLPSTNRLLAASRTLYKWWLRFWDWQPLTVRGALAVGLAWLAIELYAIPESDLVVAILGGAVVAFALLSLITLLITRYLLGRDLTTQIRFDHQNAFSKRDVPAGIHLHDSNLPPYCYLEVSRIFDHPGVDARSHLLSGASSHEQNRRLVDTIRFEHRGHWSVTELRYRLFDALGFVSFSWSRPIASSIEVTAPTIQIRALPIVAASSRAGDQLNQTRERSGDPFDLKAYDPSDGVTRILWKTYAKSRELVVRRPEPAIIPEGEVALYMIAAREDDFVAGAAQSYIEQLIENEITVLFGTDGMASQPVAGGRSPVGEGAFTSDEEKIQKAINNAAWSANAGSAKGFEAYLESLVAANRSVFRVIVFAPQRYKKGGWFDRIAKVGEAHNVQISIALVPEDLDSEIALKKRLKKAAPSRVEKTLKQVPQLESAWQKISEPGREAENPKVLTAAISQAGATVMVCEGVEGG